jgi:hypothetical protein
MNSEGCLTIVALVFVVGHVDISSVLHDTSGIINPKEMKRKGGVDLPTERSQRRRTK